MATFKLSTLRELGSLAESLEMVNRMRDMACDTVTRIHLDGGGARTKDDPLGVGGLMDVTVPRAQIVAELDQRIADMPQKMRERGVEVELG